jgi:hypothetical protein
VNDKDRHRKINFLVYVRHVADFGAAGAGRQTFAAH